MWEFSIPPLRTGTAPLLFDILGRNYLNHHESYHHMTKHLPQLQRRGTPPIVQNKTNAT